MKKFKTQYDCWHFVVNGATIYLDGMPIKFIEGALKVKDGEEWKFCPVAFENPKLFKANI